jgi:hypothetical protein
MSRDPIDGLSAEQRETAHAALVAAFGVSRIDAIAPVTGGASGASTFRLETGGRRYLLRIEGQPSPLRNPHQYTSMRIAAQAGIAPRLHYVDETTRVAVMDFIEQQPLESYPGGPRALAQALGDMLGRVQATPPFPRFVKYPDIVTRLWTHVCRTGLFAPGVLDARLPSTLPISAKPIGGTPQTPFPATTIRCRPISCSMANACG